MLSYCWSNYFNSRLYCGKSTVLFRLIASVHRNVWNRCKQHCIFCIFGNELPVCCMIIFWYWGLGMRLSCEHHPCSVRNTSHDLPRTYRPCHGNSWHSLDTINTFHFRELLTAPVPLTLHSSCLEAATVTATLFLSSSSTLLQSISPEASAIRNQSPRLSSQIPAFVGGHQSPYFKMLSGFG